MFLQVIDQQSKACYLYTAFDQENSLEQRNTIEVIVFIRKALLSFIHSLQSNKVNLSGNKQKHTSYEWSTNTLGIIVFLRSLNKLKMAVN